MLNENAAFDVSSAANPNDASVSGRADPPTEAIKPDLPEDNSTADKNAGRRNQFTRKRLGQCGKRENKKTTITVKLKQG